MKKLCMGGVFSLAIALSATSCYSTRILYGDVKPSEPLVQINQVWNHHIIEGLVPVGKNKLDASEYVNDAENFVVKTNQSFVNMLISGITFGIYTPTQTKFYIPLRDMQVPVQNGKIKSDQ